MESAETRPARDDLADLGIGPGGSADFGVYLWIEMDHPRIGHGDTFPNPELLDLPQSPQGLFQLRRVLQGSPGEAKGD